MVFKETILLTWLVGLVLGSGGYQGAVAGVGGNAIGPFVGGGACGAGGCGVDFNPVLLQGVRGYPGIRARINQRAFQYASGLIGDLLNQEIKRARIPPISQNIPQVQGCIQIYNLYVSRYRCPQRVVLYPAPPNRLILQVQNVDIGITGNLGGQIVFLLPIPLSGIIQMNIHQVTITVDLVVERGPHGPYARMLSCNVQIGYADACIQNGGIIGDIINSQFRQRISQQVREMIPGQICGQLPSIINERLNGRLASLPQAIAVTQMLSMFAGALPLGGQGPTPSPQYCQTQCRGRAPAPQLPAPQSSAVAPPAPQIPSAPMALSGPAQAPQIPQAAYNERPVARGTQQKVYHTNQAAPLRRIPARKAAGAPTSKRHRAVVSSNGSTKVFVPLVRNKRQTALTVVHRVTKLASSPTAVAHVVRTSRGAGGYQQQVYIHRPIPGGLYRPPPTIGGYYPGQGAPLGPIPPVPGAPPAMLVPPVPDLCAMCPSNGASEDPMSFLRQLAAGLDMRKLSDLYLSIQLLATHATSNDFTVDLTGEFSPNGQGGTPFGAFPVQFPYAYDGHMAEFILSDYTVNTLFYWLHRKQFLTFRIGPDTPKIGELLKTTCSEDDDDELEGTEVELDEEEAKRRRRKVARLSKTLRKLRSRRSAKSRGKRQDAGGLADLGICFGDILPAVREKYPNQKIAIQIRTVRAPSVILSQARGGMMILDLVADADIYIDGTNTRVGTITIAATIVLVAQIRGNRLTGTAEITNLKLTDRAGTLGLPQDALDNLGNLGKELIQKLANDALQKGIVINIPQGGLGGLPINIINPSVRIIEHGLYIATDITVSPSLLGIDGRGC